MTDQRLVKVTEPILVKLFQLLGENNITINLSKCEKAIDEALKSAEKPDVVLKKTFNMQKKGQFGEATIELIKFRRLLRQNVASEDDLDTADLYEAIGRAFDQQKRVDDGLVWHEKATALRTKARTNLFLKGYLEKESGAKENKFQRRWFTLEDGILAYYLTATAGSFQKDKINLQTCEKIDAPDEFSIHFKTPHGRIFKIRSTEDGVITTWRQGIEAWLIHPPPAYEEEAETYEE
jgi:hypothetical protein